MKNIGVGFTGRMPSSKWDGGTTNYLGIDRSGYREGQVIGPQGDPVAGILILVFYTKTWQRVGATRSDENGNYYFDGLRSDVSDYLFIAEPDLQKLGGEYQYATRYLIE